MYLCDNDCVRIVGGQNSGMMTGNANEVCVEEEVLDGERVGDWVDWIAAKVKHTTMFSLQSFFDEYGNKMSLDRALVFLEAWEIYVGLYDFQVHDIADEFQLCCVRRICLSNKTTGL